MVFLRAKVTSFKAKFNSEKSAVSGVVLTLNNVLSCREYWPFKINVTLSFIASFFIVAKKPNLPVLIPKIGIPKSLI